MRRHLSATRLLSVALVSAPSLALTESLEPALRSVAGAEVAILAYRDSRGRPTGRPVTPYLDEDRVVVTSTLAFMKKTVHIRRDGRVALLAGDWHFSADAAVSADISGDEFVARFLDQELRKYPPAHEIVGVPLHRWLFSWYFGRVFVELEPRRVEQRTGGDRCTLITLDAEGVPSITPIAEPPLDRGVFALPVSGVPDGPAAILIHEEHDEMRDLRYLIVRGDLQAQEFRVRSRGGSLDAPPERSLWSELAEHRDYHRRARDAKRIIRSWDGNAVGDP